MACRSFLGSFALVSLLLVGGGSPLRAADPQTIKIGVIAEESALPGTGISKGAQIAADEINAAGGIAGRKIELVIYDDHSQAADAVRAFQRLVNEDKAVGVIGSYISEVALALQPWAQRTKTPYISTGAASNEISRIIHGDYAHNRFTFQGWLTSSALADSVCDAIKGLLMQKYAIKSAVIFSEDAAWTTPLDAEYANCLAGLGIGVAGHIRFAEDTADYSPLFSQAEDKKADLLVVGLSHTGIQPIVQWAQQQVPLPMVGILSQSTNGTFWKDTNGATDGIVSGMGFSADGVALTPETQPFVKEYTRRFGAPPPYSAFPAHDSIHALARAIAKAGTADPDKLADALEQTDFVGTVGRIQYYSADEQFTHALKYGPGLVQNPFMQWQKAHQVAVWPRAATGAEAAFPAFIHLAPR